MQEMMLYLVNRHGVVGLISRPNLL